MRGIRAGVYRRFYDPFKDLGKNSFIFGNVRISGNLDYMYPIGLWNTSAGSVRKVYFHDVSMITTTGKPYAILSVEYQSTAPAFQAYFDTLLRPPIYYHSDTIIYASNGTITYPVNKQGQSGAFGTSQYTAGKYPVPTSNTRRVGAGQTYATIADAIAAASDGDSIILHPGSHSYGGTITKYVSIYGSTENPTDVTITLTDNLFGMNYNLPDLTNKGPIGMFHVTLTRTQYSYGKYVRFIG